MTQGTVYLPATTVPPTVVALRPNRAVTVASAQFPYWKLARAADQPIHRSTMQDKSPNAVSRDEGESGPGAPA